MSKEYYEENRKELYNLYLTHKTKFHVAFELGQKWVLFPDDVWETPKHYYVNHREVLPTEVIFDFDVKDAKKRDFYYERVKRKLTKYKINFKAYYTGGKGIHVSLFFDELKKYDANDKSLMKKLIIDFFFKGFAQYAKVDYQLCSRHLVRSEFGTHEKTGKFKMKFDESNLRVKKDNIIPNEVLIAFTENKEQYSRVQKSKKQFFVSEGLNNTPFKCITYLMSQDFSFLQEGRQRALTLLCNYFYRQKGDKGLDLVKEWNDYKMNGYFKEGKIRGTWNSIVKMNESGRNFGCRYTQGLLTELGVTEKVCKGCSLYKEL